MAFHSIAVALKSFMDSLQFGAALHLSHHRPPSQANAPFRSLTKFKQDTKIKLVRPKSNLNGQNIH